jgi:5-amino-6-(5-phosphoribosylamino)uracil reductase
VRSPARRSARVARGQPASPARVTITSRGDLDLAARFFTAGDGPRLIYVPGPAAPGILGRLGSAAGVEVISAGDGLGPGSQADLAAVLADLAARGVRRLMVEGGGHVLAQFLAEGLADELNLVVAPIFVGDLAAPRIGGTGASAPRRRMHLAETRLIGDVVLLRYLPGAPGTSTSFLR